MDITLPLKDLKSADNLDMGHAAFRAPVRLVAAGAASGVVTGALLVTTLSLKAWEEAGRPTQIVVSLDESDRC